MTSPIKRGGNLRDPLSQDAQIVDLPTLDLMTSSLRTSPPRSSTPSLRLPRLHLHRLHATYVSTCIAGPSQSASHRLAFVLTLTFLHCGTLCVWPTGVLSWCVSVFCVSALGVSASYRKPSPEARDRWSSGVQVLPGDRATCPITPSCDVGNVVFRIIHIL